MDLLDDGLVELTLRIASEFPPNKLEHALRVSRFALVARSVRRQDWLVRIGGEDGHCLVFRYLRAFDRRRSTNSAGDIERVEPIADTHRHGDLPDHFRNGARTLDRADQARIIGANPDSEMNVPTQHRRDADHCDNTTVIVAAIVARIKPYKRLHTARH